MNQKTVMLGWIEACIRYGGRFTAREKAAYQRVFGASAPTVSRDQEVFAERFEAACGGAVFERAESGKFKAGKLYLDLDAQLPDEPVFASIPSLERWLQDCLEEGKGYAEAPTLRREPDHWVVRVLLDGIRSRTAVAVSYQSRRGSSERALSAHTIVRAAGRLHVRAFDHLRNEYGDFVLARIAHAALDKDVRYVGPEDDEGWRSFREVLVESVGPDAGPGVAMDFGLDERGRKTMHVRQAFVQYLVDEMEEGFRSPVRVVAGDAV